MEIMAERVAETHEITLMGREFRIRSAAKREHIEALAHYVDERVREVADSQRHAGIQNVLLMAALNMADELFRIRAEQEALRDKIRDQSRSLLAQMGHRAA